MRHLLLALLLLPTLAAARPPTPEALTSMLWKALSHGPGEPADTEALRRLFADEAVVFGSRDRDGAPGLVRTEAAAFIESLAAPRAYAFHECEIAREVTVQGRFATVYSVVESRRDPSAARPDVVGVNSMQLHRGDDGWRLLSLYYHLPAPADATPPAASGRCLG